jgi:hypothetical protein
MIKTPQHLGKQALDASGGGDYNHALAPNRLRQ